MKEPYESLKEILISKAEIKVSIAKSGDEIAKKHGYKKLHGMDAIYRYLIDKYHWLPNQVRSLSTEDLQLLLDD